MAANEKKGHDVTAISVTAGKDLEGIPAPALLRLKEPVLHAIGIPRLRQLRQKGYEILFDASEAKNVRFFAEKNVFDFIMNAELHEQKDYTYQPNSGLDEVIIALMAKHDICYVVDEVLFKQSINRKPQLFSRFHQNFQLCKKTGVRMYVLNEDVLSPSPDFFASFL